MKLDYYYVFVIINVSWCTVELIITHLLTPDAAGFINVTLLIKITTTGRLITPERECEREREEQK